LWKNLVGDNCGMRHIGTSQNCETPIRNFLYPSVAILKQYYVHLLFRFTDRMTKEAR